MPQTKVSAAVAESSDLGTPAASLSTDASNSLAGWDAA